MALAYPHIKFLFEFRKSVATRSPARLIEFGEQNWFGDVPTSEILNIAKLLNSSDDIIHAIEEKLTALNNDITQGPEEKKQGALFSLAKLFYYSLFNISKHDAVDLHGTSLAKKYDLNEPLPFDDKYDIAINFGTAEHVFNQYQFHKNLHNATDVDGFIFHSMPNQGCYDHGFYNFQPTFFFDIAEHNKYKVWGIYHVDLTAKPPTIANIDRTKYIELAVSNSLPKHSAIFAVFQKMNDEPFVVPQQGYYNNTLPENLRKAWEALER